MERCVFCQGALDAAAGRCQQCGRAQPTRTLPVPPTAGIILSGGLTRQCPACGELLPIQARLCGSCAYPLPPLEQAEEKRERGGVALISPGFAIEEAARQSGVLSAPAGTQSGLVGMPGAPAWPQSGAPGVASASAGPQSGAPTVGTVSAGPQSGAPGTTGAPAGPPGSGLPLQTAPVKAAGRGMLHALRGKLLGTVAAKVIVAVVALTVVTSATVGVLAATGTRIPIPGLGGSSASQSSPPHPVLTVQSKYHVGATPAGSTTTTLHVTGQGFAPNSAITFLLDGKAIPGVGQIPGDPKGRVQVDLTITAVWAIGEHALTARDTKGDRTTQPISVKIVPQGEANTPGPHGSPSDNASFTINWGANVAYFAETISVSNGFPCGSLDDKSTLHSYNANPYIFRFKSGCGTSGSYQHGQLAYYEIAIYFEVDIPNGDVCYTYNNL